MRLRGYPESHESTWLHALFLSFLKRHPSGFYLPFGSCALDGWAGRCDAPGDELGKKKLVVGLALLSGQSDRDYDGIFWVGWHFEFPHLLFYFVLFSVRDATLSNLGDRCRHRSVDLLAICNDKWSVLWMGFGNLGSTKGGGGELAGQLASKGACVGQSGTGKSGLLTWSLRD
jgi:hypothetical protein